MTPAVPAPRFFTALLPIALALALAYGFVLISLAGQWSNDPNYAHGFFVPAMAAWLAWRRRDRFRAAPRALDPRGLVVVLAGAALYLGGVLAAELFTTRLSLVVVLTGLVLAMEGPARLRSMAFPLAFLLFMIPLPYILYYRLTFPLQIESSRLAADALTRAGLPVIREGNVLHLEGYSLEVVTACSGLRSIMTLGTIGVFLTDLVPLSRVGRLVYVALIVPVAVLANVMRLSFTAGLAAVAGPNAAESFLHELSGLVLFVSGVVALFILAGGIRWVERKRRGSQPRS
jgi:exosortase